VYSSDFSQMVTETGSVSGRWNISRPTVSGSTDNGDATSTGVVIAAAEGASANATVTTVLARDVRTSGALLPAGNDDDDDVDAPVKRMLDDARAEAARLIALSNDPTCRNTVVVLVVGGGEGTTSGLTNSSLETAAANFLNISNRRVPVYVIAIAPPASDVSGLQAIATKTGGQYFEITKAQIDAALASTNQIATGGTTAPAGTVVVPELVKAVNIAVQHAFATSADVNTAPSAGAPTGPYSEFQVTSPIIGTVNLDDGKDINGAALVPNSRNVKDKADVKIPQRSNLMVTSGFTLPGFDGKLRGFRVYKPEVDNTQLSGWKFKSDNTRLWVACAPGAGCAAEPDSTKRNLYTVDRTGSMIAFTTANAATLAPLMNLNLADATAVINSVRELPLGAVVSSTPAIMNAPSLDPPPDSTYPAFAVANKKRRTIIWVGTNNGVLSGIDARYGVEVWGFIPLNLLPKLKTLRDGQSVGSFDHFVDSSPKVSDVKYDNTWHTHLVVGQGPGGTFYQSFDVTMADQATVLGGEEPDALATLSSVLGYFSSPARITLNWAFPSYANFDPTIAPYGDVADAASDVAKTVGQTWSDPAIGQIESSASPYTVLVGSGFLRRDWETRANRDNIVGGTTFYLLNAKDGAVLDSQSVGSDGVNETNNDCRTDNADGCKKSKNALQTDPVATGPSDSRFIDRVYIGDLDGNLWKFNVALNEDTDDPEITSNVKLYSAGADQPIYSSMATVNVGGTQQYVFFGTGSDLLPQTDKNTVYKLMSVLDTGTTGVQKFSVSLAKATDLSTDERVTAFPAVAGDIVFFTTTTYKSACAAPDAKLYAFTFIGGPAYDNTGDGKVDPKKDTPVVKTVAGVRATAPFIVDQHLAFGAGNNVSMFGDPADFNNGIGQAGVRILSWREVR
jgi:hypothetical protein